MPKTPDLREWHIQAAKLMASTGQSLQQVVTQLGVEVTAEECQALVKRPFFLKLLIEERHRWYNSIGGSINLSKETSIGRMLSLAQKLEDDGEYDAAADVIFKAAKISGFVGPESTVSVFGELSQSDLDSIKKSLETKPASTISPN